MVEVDCPVCSEPVDIGSDSPGNYACPHCEEIFEHKPLVNYILKSREIVRQIESKQLVPDYLIHESTSTYHWSSKVISLIIYIPFILVIVGIFLVLSTLRYGITTEHHYFSTVYIAEFDLIIYYDTVNGKIEDVYWALLDDDSHVQIHSFGGEHPSTEYYLSSEYSSGNVFAGNTKPSEWNDFCKYRDIRFIYAGKL